MSTILSLGVALLAGFFVTLLAKKFKLPNVTAYLVAGVLLGPYCLGRIGVPGLGFSSMEHLESFSMVSSIALGFIAFAIGNEFRLSELKSIGKQAGVVGVVQALVAAAFVDVALIALHFIFMATTGTDILPIPVAITLGAIATATAPAATLMVVRQYKAKGKLTDLLLPVVALDDAVGLIVFAVSFGVADCLHSGKLDMVAIICDPLIEIVLSLALGMVIGLLLTLVQKLFKGNARTAVAIAFVLITVALTMLKFEAGPVEIGFSSLLTCMMAGAAYCNLSKESGEVMEHVETWTVPLNALFFVLSGAELELNVFTKGTVLIVGVVYIIFRCAGKYLGSYISCKATGCDGKVTKNFGIALWPQAGVALGMCVIVANEWRGDEKGAMVRNIVLLAVLVYELVGPMLTKGAMIRTGDISKENQQG